MRENPASRSRIDRAQPQVGLLDPNPTMIICMALTLAMIVLAARIVNVW
jgi:hypothetical protein